MLEESYEVMVNRVKGVIPTVNIEKDKVPTVFYANVEDTGWTAPMMDCADGLRQ